MVRPRTWWRLAWCGFVVVATLICINRFALTTSLDGFWLSEHDERDGRLMRALGSSMLARTMIFAVGHERPEVAARVASELAQRLRGHPEVERARTGPASGFDRAAYELYFPRRFAFVGSTPAEVRRALTDDALQVRARQLKAELARPTGSAIKQLAARDPWLLFPERMRQLTALESGSVEVRGGHFWAGEHALVFVTTRHPPSDLDRQAPLEHLVATEVADLEQQSDAAIERSAIARVALATKHAIERDIARVTTLSTAALLLVLLLVWRSLAVVLVLFVPLLTGVLGALAVVLLIFGRVHGITLAFGATLIGVALDYPVHLLAHGQSSGRIERSVVWAIALGSATTLAGFAALALTPLPGVQQIGAFAVVGLAVAVLATLGLPRAWPGLFQRPRHLQRGANVAAKVLASMRRRAVAVLVLAPVLAIAIVGLGRVRWIDDVHALAELSPGALEQEQRARRITGREDLGHVVVAWGANDQRALERNDEVSARLRAHAVPHRSLHAALWSEALQRENLAEVRAQADLGERTRAALAELGFRASAFAELERELARDVAPLRPDDLRASPLARVLELFRVELDDGREPIAMLTFVDDLPSAVASELSGLEGVSVFDQRAFLAGVYRRHRQQALPWLGIGVLGIVVLLGLRYRRLIPVVVALAPAALAVFATVGVLAALDIRLHLLHIVGLLLVASMGVDYGVFFGESARGEQLGPTGLAVAIAWISTSCGFGLLGLSDVAALSALGLVVAIGITFAAILAPIAWSAGELFSRGRASSSRA